MTTCHSHSSLDMYAAGLSILQHLAGSPYGATQQILLHYYKACICPILDNGSIALSIACSSGIKRMESLQNTALHIALCLTQHAQTKFVLAEARCTALGNMLKSLAMSTWTKIRSAPITHSFHQNNKNMHTSPTSWVDCHQGKETSIVRRCQKHR